MTKSRRKVAVPAPRKRRATVQLPTKLKEQISQSVLSDGYGMRGKSRWINDAVINFLADPGWLDQLESDRISRNDTADCYTLDDNTYASIRRAALKVMQEDPLNDNPSGIIIRTAICWRIFGLDSRPLRKKLQATLEIKADETKN